MNEGLGELRCRRHFLAAFLLIFEKIRLTKADFFYIIEKMFNYTSLNVCFHIAT